jgi:hypothetical protein
MGHESTRIDKTRLAGGILGASSSGDIGFFSGDIEKSKSPDRIVGTTGVGDIGDVGDVVSGFYIYAR